MLVCILKRLACTGAVKAQGLSGRALRKLPFLAHAKFLRSKGTRERGGEGGDGGHTETEPNTEKATETEEARQREREGEREGGRERERKRERESQTKQTRKSGAR